MYLLGTFPRRGTSCRLSVQPYFRYALQRQIAGSRKHHPPQPYVIETPFKQQLQIYPAGSDYQFQIVLTGGARHMLPLIKAVFEYAFKKGIARQNVRCSLKNLEVETSDGWQGILEHGIIPLHPNTISLPQHFPSDVSIQLLTPLTIRHDKKVMKAGQLTESMFLASGNTRYFCDCNDALGTSVGGQVSRINQGGRACQGEKIFIWYKMETSFQQTTARYDLSRSNGRVDFLWSSYGIVGFTLYWTMAAYRKRNHIRTWRLSDHGRAVKSPAFRPDNQRPSYRWPFLIKNAVWTLNIGFRRHLFTVELSPSGGEVFQSSNLLRISLRHWRLNPHVVGRFFRERRGVFLY